MAKATLPTAQSPEDAKVHPSERRLKLVPRPASTCFEGRCNLRGVERSLVKGFKEMSGTPKPRYNARRGRTWDRLRGASPSPSFPANMI
jgi:hypothetical protein